MQASLHITAVMSTRCHLTCVTSDGGIPLFSRTLGGLSPLPFPVLGSLNGVHMFAENYGVQLENCGTENAKVIWKDYYGSIKLTLISYDSEIDSDYSKSLLDSLFHSMVLIVGLEELKDVKKVEKLKKILKSCYPILDTILSCRSLLGTLSQTTDIIFCPETGALQSYLDAFVEACESEFGFILSHGKVVVATERWWELSPLETMLVLMLRQSLPACSCRDVAIYLPLASPSIPHRLITLEATENVEVCVICGPQPTLQEIIDAHVERFWSPVLDNLRACARCHPRNFPVSINVDSNIMAFMLINTEEGKCLSSTYPSGVMGGTDAWNVEKRTNILTAFFQSSVGSLLPLHKSHETEHNYETDDEQDAGEGDALETYWYSTDFKCYAISTKSHQIFIVFNNDIPVYALKQITLNTLTSLTKDNQI